MPIDDHTETVIWMHGLGDTADGFLDIFSTDYNPFKKSTKVIMLTAPTRKVTIAMGSEITAWYDILRMNFDKAKLEDSISIDQLKESSEIVLEVAKKEIQENLNGDESKLFLGGFSQGAALSLYTGYSSSLNLGGIIALSGHPSFYMDDILGSENAEIKKKLPTFMYHGLIDLKIQHKFVTPWATELKENGFNMEYHTEKGLGHSLSGHELMKITEFFKRCLEAKETDGEEAKVDL